MKTANIAPRLRNVTFGESRCNYSLTANTIVENRKVGLDPPQTDFAVEFSRKPPAGVARTFWRCENCADKVELTLEGHATG